MADESPPEEVEVEAMSAEAPSQQIASTGTPPTSPNFGAPRYSANDVADFPNQTNAVTDAFDAQAAKRGAIVSADISPTAGITKSQMAPLNIGTADIANGAVTTPKLDTPTQNAIHQTGDLIFSAAATRAGAVLCDGSAYGRSDPLYSALFNAIGTTYGGGDGSTTFNVPDYRGRTIVGAGTGPGLTARARGDKVGTEVHYHAIPSLSVPGLSVPQLYVPSLSVNGSVAGHAHGLGPGAACHHTGYGGNGAQFFDLPSGQTFSAGQGHVTAGSGGSGGYDGGSYSNAGIALMGTTDSQAPGVSGSTGAAYTNGGTTGGGGTGTGQSDTQPLMQPTGVANVFIKL